GREDISRFVVHLTRDDRDDNRRGGTARNNLFSILEDRSILALNPHCLFNPAVKGLPTKLARRFRVSCFTEVPLNQIHLLVQDIPRRKIKLEPYGICFTKEFILRNGGQPAFYINSYDDDQWLRECVDELYAISVTSTKLKPRLWRILPFIN